MQNLETLQARYDVLESLIDTAEQNRNDLYTSQRQRLAKVLEKFFTPEEGDTVKVSYASVEIASANSNDSFMTIYVNDSWNDNDEKEYTNLVISNYSFRTEEMAEWVVERFEKQAHYTRIAVDFQDDILAEMNQEVGESNEILDNIYSNLNEMIRERKEVTEQIDAIRKEARLKALMSEEGLEINGVEKEKVSGETYRVFPYFQVKFDWTLRDIRGLRIDRVSASGKSADITVKLNTWDHIKQKVVITDKKIEGVRMDKIDQFLRFNQLA
jgi:uncharacterized coiled-coil protein SlyX